MTAESNKAWAQLCVNTYKASPRNDMAAAGGGDADADASAAWATACATFAFFGLHGATFSIDAMNGTAGITRIFETQVGLGRWGVLGRVCL